MSSDAFQPLLEDELTLLPTLETLNITNLETEISPDTVITLLNQLPEIKEITLGVAYDLSEANKIVAHVNAVRQYFSSGRDTFFVDVEQCHTIRKYTQA